MKIRIKQLLTSVVFAAVLTMFLPVWTMTAYAADGRIAFSDKTASVGSEVEINMKVTLTGGGALSNATVMLGYDSSKLEFISGTGASGGAGAVRVSVGGDTTDARELVSTLKFKVIQAGASNISVNTQEVYDSSNQVVNISQLGSSTITGQAPANASMEASLADLKVSPGTLTPEFSPDIFVYSANVDADVSKITVNAPAKDEKASVVLSGNEELQPGGNQVVCRVVAEDGTTMKEYTITVNRAGDGTGGEAPAGSIAVETPAKTVTIIPLEEGVSIPAGFAECTIKINGQDALGWIWATDTEHRYCVFYGMNEAGEKDFYRYDLAEKTMQRYFQDPAAENNVSMEEFTALANVHNSLVEDYKLRLYIMIGLGAAAAILLLIVIVLLSSRRRGGDDEYTNYEEKLNDRRESVRRVAEGLPSQRAKIQTGEPAQPASPQTSYGQTGQIGQATYGQTGQTAYGQTGQTAYGQTGQATYGQTGQTGQATYGQTGQTAYGQTGQTTYGQTGQTAYGQTGQTTYGQTGQTGQTGYAAKPAAASPADRRSQIPQTPSQPKPAPRPQQSYGYEDEDDDDGFEFLDLDE